MKQPASWAMAMAIAGVGVGAVMAGAAMAGTAARPTADEVVGDLATSGTGAAGKHHGTLKFMFTTARAIAKPAGPDDEGTDAPDIASAVTHKTKQAPEHKNAATVGVASDGSALWVAADMSIYAICGDEGCDKAPPDATDHVTAVYDGAAGWQPIAWHWGTVLTDAQAAKALGKDELSPVERDVAGADDIAKRFEATIGDAKALAATVSDRADVVLYGSGPGERYVGGAQVRAKLTAWNLSLKVHGGVRAGMTGGKTIAWVGANVDATSPKKSKATSYRALFVYEKTGGEWKLVVAQFSSQADA